MSGSRRRDYAGAGLTARNSPLVLTLIVIFLASSIVTDAASAQQLVVRVLAAAVMVIALGSLSGLPRPAPAGVCSISLVVATVAPAALVFASWTRIPGAGDYLWSWPLFLAGIIEVTLCFKGRLRTAIVIHLGVAAALAVRASQVDGTPATAAPALVSYLPMFLVSLLIAFYVRPVADEIAALRDSGDAAGRLADIAVAVVVVRNERLDWIDRTAGPWLRRIASGIPLDDAERRACLFLEASIRDVLRAPGLVGPELDRVVPPGNAAWRWCSWTTDHSTAHRRGCGRRHGNWWPPASRALTPAGSPPASRHPAETRSRRSCAPPPEPPSGSCSAGPTSRTPRPATPPDRLPLSPGAARAGHPLRATRCRTPRIT